MQRGDGLEIRKIRGEGIFAITIIIKLSYYSIFIFTLYLNISILNSCFTRFGLFEAMSAIEMMDPKMDAGMLCNQIKRKVFTLEQAIEVAY